VGKLRGVVGTLQISPLSAKVLVKGLRTEIMCLPVYTTTTTTTTNTTTNMQ